jgi:hypothetical protein
MVHKKGEPGGRGAPLPKWTCPSCGLRRAGAYCPSCGEEPLRPRDLKVDDLAGKIFQAFSSVDGRLMRSFRLLLTRPGALSAAYVEGQRRKYLTPLHLFFIANALFFAVQTLTSTQIFSSPLASHLHQQDWSPLARELTAARLAERGQALADFAPTFDTAAVLNAKALIVLMALALAPLLPAFFMRPRRAFGAHVVFALHFHTFVLLLLCLSLLLAEATLLGGGEGLASKRVDVALSLFNLGAIGAYLYLAAGRFYASRGAARIAKAAAIAALVAAIALGYRFVIFLITLYTS